MTVDIIAVQLILGVSLFFIINWIGKHSYSIGYISLSVFVKSEDAPAFNFILRVFTPIVYLIITASILYLLKLDKYTTNFYIVNIYYIGFRLLFNLITGRTLLIDWYRQVFYWVIIILFSYFTYEKLIFTKKNILPDFTTIANELWIIILVFLFHVANNVQLSQTGTIKRKEKYLIVVYTKFKKLYGNIIDMKFQNDKLKALAYSILIYENFNRPKIARLVENINFSITKKPHTLGVMQFYTNKMISDYESVNLGTTKILTTYKRHIEEYKGGKKEEPYTDSSLIADIISDYNSGIDYLLEVDELYSLIVNKFYKNSQELVDKPN